MKHSALWLFIAGAFFICCAAHPAAAQLRPHNQNAMTGAIHKVSGYSEAVVKYADLAGDLAWLVGGRVGVTLNTDFSIGGAYYTKVDNAVPADFRFGDRAPNLSFQYGGLDFEYTIRSRKLFHVTIQALIGLGGYSFTDPEDVFTFANKMFYILEPGANIEMNMTDWLRLQLGATFRILFPNSDNPDDITYRTGRQVQDYHFNHNDLSNIGFQFGVKFGDFSE